jgi:hypothetical protein
MPDQSYLVQCFNAEQARTFLTPHWFAKIAHAGKKADEIIITLDDNQAANFERDFPGAKIMLIPEPR